MVEAVEAVSRIKSHQYAFDRLQVLGVQTVAAHLKGVDMVACREAESVVAHGVALVVVADGIAEVNGIGCVVLERILQLYDDTLA